MEIIEYVAEHLHIMLSDLHYAKYLTVSMQLFMEMEGYSLDQWQSALEYIFCFDEQVPKCKSVEEVKDVLYERIITLDRRVVS